MRARLHTILAIAAILFAAPVLRAQAPAYQVIVNAANPVASADARDVSRIFRKQTTRWKDGSTIAPADQRMDSPVRAAFSQGVHRRPVSVIAEFWRQEIFSGRSVPPVEKSSDAEVLAFVGANRGAIGYVSTRAPLPPTVRALAVTGS